MTGVSSSSSRARGGNVAVEKKNWKCTPAENAARAHEGDVVEIGALRGGG